MGILDQLPFLKQKSSNLRWSSLRNHNYGRKDTFGQISLPETDATPENRPGPKRKCHLPTIHLQLRTVSFREGNITLDICHVPFINPKERKTSPSLLAFLHSNWGSKAGNDPNRANLNMQNAAGETNLGKVFLPIPWDPCMAYLATFGWFLW